MINKTHMYTYGPMCIPYIPQRWNGKIMGSTLDTCREMIHEWWFGIRLSPFCPQGPAPLLFLSCGLTNYFLSILWIISVMRYHPQFRS